MKMRPNVSRKGGSRSRLIALMPASGLAASATWPGFSTSDESVPIVRDPEPDATLPRILLIGQAPGLRATAEDRPFAGTAGDKLRDWLEQAGIPRDDFWRKVHFAAITRCYPGRVPGAKGDRVPSPQEQALCRPWLDELLACDPASNRASGRPAGDPHLPRPSRLVDSRRGHFHDSRRRSLHPPAASLRRQPMAERAGQSRGG